jgi:acyl-CoA reductase-like NAD-dependent aldehyde dehydrogenase
MADVIKVENPFSGEVVTEVPLLELNEATRRVERAARVQKEWARTPLADRIKVVERFNELAAAAKEQLARDITAQMGKPLGQARGEVDGMIFRSKYLVSIAQQVLADEVLPEKAGFVRKIVREPLGVVLNIAPWNYPLLTVINVLAPAVLSGNAVIIKHAPQTPLCGQSLADLFTRAGAPEGLVQAFQASHPTLGELMQRPEIAHVAFTGSVRGGHEVLAAASKRFVDVGLELGGKDPGYVAADANFAHAVENLVDGAFYNAGQSCCGIERIYVHQSLYDRFVEAATALVKAYVLGDPLDEKTTLGPLTLPRWPKFLQEQVDEASKQGGRVLCGGKPTTVNGKGRFFEPCVVADAPQASSLMQEESFGPVVGIAKVADDDEALRRMNDSRYGLTCAIWTEDVARAERMSRELQTGTVFMNRCDYLDPALPWTGVKDSGKGETLSHLGFMHLTRVKSLHFRTQTK